MSKTKNKWAVILGGSSGLGLATAHKLAEAGYHLCLVHRDRKTALAQLAKDLKQMQANGIEVISFNKDALKKEVLEEVLSNLPNASVSLLIHSIAKGSLQPLYNEGKTLSKQDLDITLHAMATSWWEWTQALIEQNKWASTGSTLAFTSEGNTKVWPGYGAVSAAKATLEALMRQMAVELAPLHITANCIQAGTTQTASFNMIPGSETLATAATKRNPYKRMTTPKDVANAVYLLSLEEARWINGTILKVDGGESLR